MTSWNSTSGAFYDLSIAAPHNWSGCTGWAQQSTESVTAGSNFSLNRTGIFFITEKWFVTYSMGAKVTGLSGGRLSNASVRIALVGNLLDLSYGRPVWALGGTHRNDAVRLLRSMNWSAPGSIAPTNGTFSLTFKARIVAGHIYQFWTGFETFANVSGTTFTTSGRYHVPSFPVAYAYVGVATWPGGYGAGPTKLLHLSVT